MRKDLLTHNWLLKFIALGLAIITWIYVNGEIVPNEARSTTNNLFRSR